MPETRNLCAQLPLDLHQRVCMAREQSGLTTAQYITNLLLEYYEMKENGGKTTMANNSRTMAFQIPETLFQRIKAHLERETQRTGRKLTQREFVLNLIEEALIEAEEDAAEEAERVNASMVSASPTGTTTEEDDSEEDLPPEKP
ncbi:translation initiation factor 2 [Oscillospiraceae bacterium 38-13]